MVVPSMSNMENMKKHYNRNVKSIIRVGRDFYACTSGETRMT